jgi:demethylmenaquinone methyltransferase/2-methoxy-6-polyprenyl-1,4-benzoquinol methylase
MSETHFGFSTVDERVKAERVRGVFDSVAPKYDVMNDLMSLGLHRCGRRTRSPPRGFARATRSSTSLAAPAISRAPSPVGSARAASSSIPTSTRPCCATGAIASWTKESSCRRCSATPNRCLSRAASFDLVSVAFGLRNMTHKDKALAEMARVPQARAVACSSSSSRRSRRRSPRPYDWYSFNVLPRIGRWVAATARAIATSPNRSASIPDQATLKAMMKSAGFGHVDVHNLSAGRRRAARGDQVLSSGRPAIRLARQWRAPLSLGLGVPLLLGSSPAAAAVPAGSSPAALTTGSACSPALLRCSRRAARRLSPPVRDRRRRRAALLGDRPAAQPRESASPRAAMQCRRERRDRRRGVDARRRGGRRRLARRRRRQRCSRPARSRLPRPAGGHGTPATVQALGRLTTPRTCCASSSRC